MGELIHLENLTKDYQRLRALDDVSVSLDAGTIGLLGPNGAGKTTLIKVLLGLVRITHGTASVLGHRLHQDAKIVRSKTGYMPEDDCYVAKLCGVEMVQMAARLSGLPSTEALRRAHEILDFCGVEQERYRPVETYSTGMRQKLKFAQAIVHDPPFLILDEPTSGLDPDEREALLNRVRMLAKQSGKSVLVSTHILPDVQTICDTVVILAGGRVRIVDRLEALSQPTSPSFEIAVFGDADRLAARIRQAGIRVEQRQDGKLKIDNAAGDVGRRVWTWARELGVGIRTFTPARNSLEQIFLEAVQGEHRADS